MRFPNAFEGVKKIYTAEILYIIAAIVMVVAAALVVLAAGTAAGAFVATTAVGGSVAFAGLLAIAGAVLLIIAFIMNLVGLGKAKNDHENFKTAWIFTLIGIVVAIVAGFVFKDGTIGKTLCDAATKILSLLTMVYVVKAIGALATTLANAEMQAKSSSITNLIVITNLIAIVLNILPGFVKSLAAGTIFVIISFVVLVFQLIAYISYLGYLSKAKVMLSQPVVVDTNAANE